MFRRTVKLLEASHLARMAHLESDALGGSVKLVTNSQGCNLLTPDLLSRSPNRHQPHEAALVMLHTSRCAEKLRTIFAEISWDSVLAPWLNGTLLDSLDCELLEECVTRPQNPA